MDVANSAFYDGLKQNKSIDSLDIWFRSDDPGVIVGVGQKILEAYQENSSHLTEISINCADLQNGAGDRLVAATLRRCTNIKQIDLYRCSITDEQLLPIVDAIREHSSLERLSLTGNMIGSAGCGVLATLLEDQNYNLQMLRLNSNRINIEGATILANGLANNTRLRELWLYNNPIDRNMMDSFAKLLCNMSSINDTYSSNHTLDKLTLHISRGDELDSLLQLNGDTNKSHVAIKKILKYHPFIDMEPLFEWNVEGEGERDLKALPYIAAWFDRAREAVAGEERGGSCNIEKRKLTAIYQFAKAMPLMFVPSSHAKGGDNKRKRDDHDQLIQP